MTITYVQASPPLWYMVGLDGLAAGGAQLFTYDSLTRLPKAVYQDPAGALAYPNPIIFDLNGTAGPFYWQVNSSDPDDSYYIEAFDSAGNPLWEENNFPSVASGGGGDVTEYLSFTNYITNNQFINHIAPTANPVGVTNLVIAPSNHKGFTPALINPIVGTYGVLGPDIRFIKNNTSATDQITFPLFALDNAPLTGDITPVDYIRYQCTNTPTGETYKNFQFPITQKVKNLSGAAMTFTLWAAVTSSDATINIYLRQYYGSGTGSTGDTRTLIGSCSLTTTWTPFNIQFNVPSVADGSLGTTGLQTDDDAVYLQIEMPLDAPCDVLFTKPCLFLGSISPDIQFDSYDQIDSIDQTPRTGDIRVSLTSSAPQGWLPMNDGTIGNTGSGASLAAGAYTFQLYKTLWDGISNTYAPVSSGRGSSALADFLAGKTLQLPLSLGRALAGAGAGSGLTSRALGQNIGTENNTISTSQVPNQVPVASSSSYSTQSVQTGVNTAVPGGLVTWSGGGGQPVNNMQPTSFMNVFIKL